MHQLCEAEHKKDSTAQNAIVQGSVVRTMEKAMYERNPHAVTPMTDSTAAIMTRLRSP